MMLEAEKQITENLIEAFGRMAESAGFNRMIGQIYALLYLSPAQLSLGKIAEKLNTSKGNVSLNTTNMERWGMIKRFNRPADRHDYYEADVDFWRVIRGILHNREMKIISDFRSSIAKGFKNTKKFGTDKEAKFYQARFKHLLDFITTFTRLFNAYLALEKFNFTGLGLTANLKEADENG
jgi:DNA-binding transcriptional regulator GbsR (MarR family)